MKIFSSFNPPLVSGLTCNTPSMTQQSDKALCDLECIVKRAIMTGQIDPSLVRQFGKFADATTYEDFMHAQLTYRRGIEAFESLPEKLRTRFRNDPNNLLKFLEDENNRDEAIELGLIEAKKEPAPESPVVVPDGSLDITGTTDSKQTESV